MVMSTGHISVAQASNKFCPRSGKAIVEDSLATFKGDTVGFCNLSCRDSFASDISNNPSNTDYFDAVIKENEL